MRNGQPRRGVELIEAVIERVLAGEHGSPGLAESAIDAMRLADGEPLPDSLRLLLGVRGPSAQFPGPWHEGEGSALDHIDIATLLQRAYPADVLAAFNLAPLIDGLPGRCHPLGSDTPLSFLYVGFADEWGEYPVLTLQDFDDCLEVVMDHPGLDVYLACASAVVERPRYYGGIAEHKAYGPMLDDAVKRNFATPPQRRAKQYIFAAELAL